MMSLFQNKLIKLILEHAPSDGFHSTAIPGVRLVRFSEPRALAKTQWHSSLAIVAQGFKEIALEDQVYRYKQAHYIATPVDLLVSSRVPSASKEKPFLSILIAMNPSNLESVGRLMDQVPPAEPRMKTFGVFTGEAEAELIKGAIRLIELLERGEEARVLGPLVIQEVFFFLLKTSNGASLRQFAASGTKLRSVADAVRFIKSSLDREIDIDSLAKTARMSRTSFFNAFKSVTAMSPIQYQKRLRLMEARQLLISGSETAEGAAYRVGYKSASQFSREYSRLFGLPPSREIAKVRI